MYSAQLKCDEASGIWYVVQSVIDYEGKLGASVSNVTEESMYGVVIVTSLSLCHVLWHVRVYVGVKVVAAVQWHETSRICNSVISAYKLYMSVKFCAIGWCVGLCVEQVAEVWSQHRPAWRDFGSHSNTSEPYQN